MKNYLIGALFLVFTILVLFAVCWQAWVMYEMTQFLLTH